MKENIKSYNTTEYVNRRSGEKITTLMQEHK